MEVGPRVAGLQIDNGEVYQKKYKIVTECFRIMHASLAGGYVPFGIFRLYSDPALDNVGDDKCLLIN
jgi:hypothetical protein